MPEQMENSVGLLVITIENANEAICFVLNDSLQFAGIYVEEIRENFK